jgi:putative membrane protein (TIGR04086 family)
MNQLKANTITMIIGSITTFILLFALNTLVHFNNFEESKIGLYSFITSLIIFLVLGFIGGNIKNKNGLVNGFIISLIFVVIFVVISFFTKSLQISHIVRYIIMLLAGGLGGIIGVNFKPLVK